MIRRGLVPGLVVAACFLLVQSGLSGWALRLPAGGFGPAVQIASWLPWQIADNVRHARSPFDASIFGDPSGSLLGIIGNPGASLLFTPFYLFIRPDVANAIVLAVCVLVNTVGLACLGGRFGRPWLGATLGISLGLTERLADFAYSDGLIGLAALSLAWVNAPVWGKRALDIVCVLAAPLPTLGVALAAGRYAWAGAALASALLFPPVGSVFSALAGDSGLAPRAFVWLLGYSPLCQSIFLVPLLAGLVWNRRFGAAPWLVGAVLICALQPPIVQGAKIAGLPLVSGGWVVAGAAFLLVQGLDWSRSLIRERAAALTCALWVEALAAGAVGPGRLWHDQPWPSEFAALRERPRSAVLSEAQPGAPVTLGAGYIPFHRQYVTTDFARGTFADRNALRAGVLVVTRRSSAATLAGAKFGEPTAVGPGFALWSLR